MTQPKDTSGEVVSKASTPATTRAEKVFENVLDWHCDPAHAGDSIADCARDLDLPYNRVYKLRRTRKFQERMLEMSQGMAKIYSAGVLNAARNFAIKEAKNQNDRRLLLQLAGLVDARGLAINLNVEVHQSVERIVAEDPLRAVECREKLKAQIVENSENQPRALPAPEPCEASCAS